MTTEMNAHQTLIAENEIEISKLPAKLQAKITKFNELDKKKYMTPEDEEEIEEQDGVIFDKITEWLDEQDKSEPEPEPKPEPKKTPKAKKEAEPIEKDEEAEEAEEKFATAPTATPKKKDEKPEPPKPKEKVFNPVLGIFE